MTRDSILIIVLILGLIISVLLYNRHLKNKIKFTKLEEDRYDFDLITKVVKDTFNDILKVNLYEMNLSKEAFEKRVHNKNQLRKALKNCTYGDVNAKNYIKEYIRDIIVNRYDINEGNINLLMPFHSTRHLSTQDRFEIMLYHYKRSYQQGALEQLIKDYNLAKPKKSDNGIRYVITEDDIKRIYDDIYPINLSFSDKVAIVTQRIYQKYKGYGVIDEIRDMQIDGISGGVSGIPPAFRESMTGIDTTGMKEVPFNYDAVWLFFKGKTIHLSFLSFGSERELIRICKNIYRYNKPGQLSESNGYKINEMKDGSRIVVARPPFSESWVFFVRKFDSVQKCELSELIIDSKKEYPIELIKWLVRGSRITAITGSQGTGKTTLLMAIIHYINPAYTLRIQETAFELNLRKVYPFRNIVTFRETATISGQEGLDLQKKTDGTVNILGEVATAPIASLMIQMAQVASLFTLFTHHAKTAENLIYSLRNNLLQTKVFSNEKVAEQQVADVVNFDIHLEKDVSGHRYIERITEIIPVDFKKPYPKAYQHEMDEGKRLTYFMNTMSEFFERMTDRQTFEARDLIRYESGSYQWVNEMSEKSKQAIKQYLTLKEGIDFDRFVGQVSL